MNAGDTRIRKEKEKNYIYVCFAWSKKSVWDTHARIYSRCRMSLNWRMKTKQQEQDMSLKVFPCSNTEFHFSFLVTFVFVFLFQQNANGTWSNFEITFLLLIWWNGSRLGLNGAKENCRLKWCFPVLIMIPMSISKYCVCECDYSLTSVFFFSF